MSRNYSGFAGYPAASIYPNMGDGVSQTMATLPDPEEIEALSAQEPDQLVGATVSSDSKKQIWIALAALVGLLLVFGIPKG